MFSASVELILKIYLAKLLEIKQKRFHKAIFEKLLNTSLDYLYGTNIGGILNWFSVSFNKRKMSNSELKQLIEKKLNISDFETFVKMIQSIILITISLSLLVVFNYWLTSCVLLILIGGQIFSFHIIFKGRLEATLSHYTMIEIDSRKKLFQRMINNLRGRDVIQSFDRTSEFSRE